jgi:hypothetical protein
MVRWGAVCAVALALLAAPAVLDTVIQPALQAMPFAARHYPGGVITLDLEVRQSGAPSESLSETCFFVSIEQPSTREDHRFYDETSSSHVCPRTVSDVVLVVPKALGTLVIEHNGTAHRIPFLVPAGSQAGTWAGVGPEGLQVGAVGTLRDTGRSETPWMWWSALQGLLMVGFIGALAARLRMAGLAGLLAGATVLYIPFAVAVRPHLPGWLLAVAWAVLLAEAYWRMPDGKGPTAADGPHGEPLDQAPPA